MSNEIKYVNEAGVRRIITDTRARLTDLTTDMDSAFGFSLDLSDFTVYGSNSKTIKFNLPKEFSTDENDIYLKFMLAPYSIVGNVSLHFSNKNSVFNSDSNRIPINSFLPNPEYKLIKFVPNDTSIHSIYLRTISNISQVRYSGSASSGSYNRIDTGIDFRMYLSYRFYVEDGLYILELTPHSFSADVPTSVDAEIDSSCVETHFTFNDQTVKVTSAPITNRISSIDNPDNIKPTFTVSNMRVLLHKKLEATVE